jgi:biopolymer transport protein ExbD
VNVLWSEFGTGGGGSYEIDDKKFTDAAELSPLFQAKVAQSPEMRVLIRADKEVRYDFLKPLLRTIGNAKVSNVTFSVVDKEAPAAAPKL